MLQSSGPCSQDQTQALPYMPFTGKVVYGTKEVFSKHRQTTTNSQTGILYLMDGISLFKSIPYSLNCHSLRHMGQCACDVCEFTHFKMQWRWNAWLHAPQISGQSSPGSLQSGQQPSKAILHIPHVSSWASQVHEATACHCSSFTFIVFLLSWITESGIEW